MYIILVGKSATGKDTVLKEILKSGSNYEPIISYTTRPIREGEVDGREYHFTTAEDFKKKIDNKQVIEYTYFRGWFYGVGVDKIPNSKHKVVILNPEGAKAFIEKFGKDNCCVILLEAEGNIRLIRSLSREGNSVDIDEVFRRYKTDEADFKDFDFWNYRFHSDVRTGKDIAKDIVSLIEVGHKDKQELKNQIAFNQLVNYLVAIHNVDREHFSKNLEDYTNKGLNFIYEMPRNKTIFIIKHIDCGKFSLEIYKRGGYYREYVC